MSTTTIVQLFNISNKLFTIGITIEIIFGIIGSIFLLIILNNHRFRRIGSSMIYLSAVNISSLIVLMTVAFGQMLDITYGTSLKWSLINEIWCRFRNSIGTVASLTAPTCICLAAIDQWIITSHSVHHRRWSTRRLAYLTIFLNVSFWFLLTGIPIFIFTGLIPNGNSIVCSYLSQSFATYNNIFFIPIIYCLLPISILTICGILTWKNIQRLRRSLVRQIGRMIFIQITSTIITTVPLCIAAIYLAITTNTMKTLLQQVVESLIVTIARLCFFLAYSYHFYIYLLSSKHMRRIVFEQCLKIKRKVASTLPTHPTRNMAVIPVNP